VAAVGLSEPQARARGLAVRTGRFPFSASGKAQALAEPEGFAKAVVDVATGALLGMHLIGPEVTELLPEAVLQVGREDGVQALAESVHAHPTLAESLHEAVLAALGQPIHI
jgi:dihydrolipoamide dehydrogenase